MKNFNGRGKLAASLIIAVVAMMVINGAGCAKKGSRGDAQGKGALKIGFSQMEENNPWRIAETNSLRDEAKKRGGKFELVVTNAQGQTSKQVSDVEDLIAQRVDAIFLAPREFEGLGSALQRAKQANIPVFLIDREAAGTAGQDFVAFLGSNFVEQGKRAGDWLVKRTNGKAGIVELTGTAGASVARDRSAGFKEAIQSSPDMKILASQTGNFSRAEGQKVMENIIQAHGKEITAVYAHNDEMALGAIQALKAAGMNPGKDVLIVSVDGEKAALEAIVRGEMNITVESNPRFGPLAFDTLEKFLRKEAIPPKIILEDKFFDSSNAAQFVNEAY
ncbi:MAG: galactofuranose transport system substrate-binding protein [Blastocatellia bacterium]|jgi:ribose transport system substrate-binding protein|nr:galactofuranose transport system substrate-binding protein [Blastocatellia bacterium]